jgi:hypothetical protein
MPETGARTERAQYDSQPPFEFVMIGSQVELRAMKPDAESCRYAHKYRKICDELSLLLQARADDVGLARAVREMTMLIEDFNHLSVDLMVTANRHHANT